MTYSFSGALRDLWVNGYKSVRERVLPTPGKRKRGEEEADLLAENQPPKQRVVESQDGKQMGAAVSAEPHRERASIATPVTAPRDREKHAEAPEGEQTPAASLRPFTLPGLSAYETSGTATGGSGRDSGTQQLGLATPARFGQRKLQSRLAGLQQRRGQTRQWQRHYPHWGAGTPARTFASALELPANPLRLERSPQPASSQLGQLAASGSSRGTPQPTANGTLQAVAEPCFAGTRPTQQPLPARLSAAEPLFGPLRSALGTREAASPELAVARFELDRVAQRRAAQAAAAERERLMQDCDHLFGVKQSALLERTRVALREVPAGRDAAAELSRLSMGWARSQAAMLAGGISEADYLEEHQRRLAGERTARAAAAASSVSPSEPPQPQPAPKLQRKPAAKSAAKPAAKPASKPAAPADVVDLGSSSDEEEEPAAEQAEAAEAIARESGSEGEEAELVEQLRAVGVSDARCPPGFRPLSRRQRQAYADAMDEDADQERELKLHKGTNIGVSRGILACLAPRVWLNDEVVNLWMGLLQERDRQWRGSGRFPKCHFFNSFFFNKLYNDRKRYEYGEVSRWTRPARLKAAGQPSRSVLECDRLICPVHLPAHWVCACADLRRRELLFLDSMASRPKAMMDAFRRYVADEFRDKAGEEVDTRDWPIRYPAVPQQENGSDCGVFAIIFAEHLARDAPLDFAQADMPYFRALVTASLMDLKAPDHF